MNPMAIAIIGGTGPQGKGLGYRLALSGHRVVLGSRSEARAIDAAEEMSTRVGRSGSIAGASNVKAAAASDVAVLAVPYEGHDELVASLRDELRGKVVVSCVNPLGFDKSGAYGLQVEAGSAAEAAAALLPDSAVVGAFHHLSAVTLMSGEPLDEDVLVCGDDSDAKTVVMELARGVTGRPGVAAGKLRLARHLEPLTAVLIAVNRAYKTHSGIRITGLPPEL
ncbi:MAG: reduced coenzyme oxidoreductase [Blastococcus sp.]|jgi:NADPH-dependent F420 reductase|nr:reduced coenzyme oxidoreductase [Blastococcus sp.]